MESDKVRDMKFFKISLFLLFICITSSPVSAEIKKDETNILNYTPVTYKDMMSLMWKYKVHDNSDPKIMDYYLQIVNCELYLKYSNDDFVWQKIREGMRRDIDYFSATFPNRFEIYAFMPIERYDFKKNVFVIPQQFALSNAGSIQIPFFNENKSDEKCIGSNDRLRIFPNDIKFMVDNKFSLAEIPVSPDRASEILENIKKFKYENSGYDRIFPVRFRIKINAFDSHKVGYSSSQLILKGELDEIAFFEDPARTKLIWQKQFKKFK